MSSLTESIIRVLTVSESKGRSVTFFRDDLFPAAFGSRTRIDAGGSYVKADGTSSATNSNFNVNIVIAKLRFEPRAEQ